MGTDVLDLTRRKPCAQAGRLLLSGAHFSSKDLKEKLREFRPRVLAFTGKRAAREFLQHQVAYGLQPERCEETRLFVLPSPSGAARRYWDVIHWRDLAKLRMPLA